MSAAAETIARARPVAPRRTHITVVIGAVLVLAVIVAALVSFVWTPFDAFRTVTADRLLPPGAEGHLLGTEQFGRDIVSMLMVGARTTLFVGILAVGIAMLVGVPLGALATIGPRWLGELLMRGSDVMYAFPAVLMAIMLSGAFGPGTTVAMVAIGIAYVPLFARVTRGAALQVLQRDYVLAARAYGRRSTYIFARHVLPNISSVLIVQATVSFALAILAEAALSYLGIGTQPPTPSWGRMLKEAQSFLSSEPLLALWPGLAIALSVLGLNLLGDGLRDALDPRLAKRAGPVVLGDDA